MHTQVVLFDGFDPLDAVAPYETLYAGGSASDGAVTVERACSSTAGSSDGRPPRLHHGV